MDRPAPVDPEGVVALYERASGVRLEPYRALGLLVWPSREVSVALGYERDHVATLMRGGRSPAVQGEHWLVLDGEPLVEFQARYRERLEWQSLSAFRLTLLTAAGMFEAMCRAGTAAARCGRRIVVNAAEATGVCGRLIARLISSGPDAFMGAPLVEQPRLWVIKGGRG